MATKIVILPFVVILIIGAFNVYKCEHASSSSSNGSNNVENADDRKQNEFRSNSNVRLPIGDDFNYNINDHDDDYNDNVERYANDKSKRLAASSGNNKWSTIGLPYSVLYMKQTDSLKRPPTAIQQSSIASIANAEAENIQKEQVIQILLTHMLNEEIRENNQQKHKKPIVKYRHNYFLPQLYSSYGWKKI